MIRSLLVLLCLLAACAAPYGGVGGKSTILTVPPDFTGKTIEGEVISLYANRGKVTVIDFWGFW